MIAWPHFGKRRCKKPVACDARVGGVRRDDEPEIVQIRLADDDERRLMIEMSVDEARVLGRALLEIWGKR